MDQMFQLISEDFWWLEIALGALVFICINYALKKVLKFFRLRFLVAAGDWREKVDEVFFLPLHCIIWILGLAYIFEVLARHFDFEASLEYVKTARGATVAVCLGWLALKWKTAVQHAVIARHASHGKGAIDVGMARILGRLATLTILVITGMIVLQLLGLDIVPLVAFGGIGAAAIGFAGKDVIANFFGGLMLYITRPFTIGDLILLHDKGIEGHVEEIGWYLTSIRDKDKRPVYLPNAIFSTMAVINSSRMSHRRIEETLLMRLEDLGKIDAITKSIKKALSSHPSIDSHLPLLVNFTSFKSESLNIYIETYSLETKYEQFLKIKQEILLLIHEIIASHGGALASHITNVRLTRSDH